MAAAFGQISENYDSRIAIKIRNKTDMHKRRLIGPNMTRGPQSPNFLHSVGFLIENSYNLQKKIVFGPRILLKFVWACQGIWVEHPWFISSNRIGSSKNETREFRFPAVGQKFSNVLKIKKFLYLFLFLTRAGVDPNKLCFSSFSDFCC